MRLRGVTSNLLYFFDLKFFPSMMILFLLPFLEHTVPGTAVLFSSIVPHQRARCPYAFQLENPQSGILCCKQQLWHTATACEMEGPSHLAIQKERGLAVLPETKYIKAHFVKLKKGLKNCLNKQKTQEC